MLPKGVHIEGVPSELEELLAKDAKAKAFFESLTKGYKQGYCDLGGLSQAGSDSSDPGRKGVGHVAERAKNA